MEKTGARLFSIILPADEFQVHAILEGGRQGGGQDRWSFPADYTDGAKPSLACCVGGCDEMIGPGAAKGDDRSRRRLKCLLEMSFQFEPFVSGDDRMEEIQTQDVGADVFVCSFGTCHRLQ
jgi:hypothetical protein